ncbi:MAG: hypothetical protein OXE93_03235 [bacterium]|nr:hypothetical protein [bacterium]
MERCYSPQSPSFRQRKKRANSIKELLTPTTLVLSAARKAGDPAIKNAGHAIARIAEINSREMKRKWGHAPIHFHARTSQTYSLFEDKSFRDTPVFDAVTRGEADASLHPRLSTQLINMFQDPQTNPRNAQLILATHDTSLLSTLNRDEVWFTEKTSYGFTNLFALAEFGGNKVRRSLNIEPAYLQGRFGAIPEIDHTDVRQALGI